MKLKLFFLLAISLLLFSCASRKASQESEDLGGINLLGGIMEGSAGGISTRAHGSLRAEQAVDLVDYTMESEDYSSARRMVNYTGEINLESATPEAIIDTVVQRAIAKGGSVSIRRNGYVSLQIPIAEFRTFFNYILTLGKVLRNSIAAEDITDAYADNASRLRIAESTLARLQALLATAKSEHEKVALLKEIQRISEQIEQRKLTEKELLRKAAFSTINLFVRNAQVIPLGANIKAFEWFMQIPNMYSFNEPIKLKVPEGFIETEDSGKRWSAASALNTEFIAFERENNPRGTPDFWTEAMREFFKRKYNTEIKESILRLQSTGPEPIVYYITVLKGSDKKTLRIAVAKFPSLEAEQKNSDAVKTVLKEAK